MPDLSEFVAFVAEKSGIRKPSLIEKDILIHRILKGIKENFGDSYLFKGGSCIVKCYFGYYRFSVDLDFTWREQEKWKSLGKRRLRKELVAHAGKFASVLESISGETELDFRCDLKNTNYVEFGSGSRMVTFKLWKDGELIKVQVNFVEELLFPHENRIAETLLSGKRLKRDEMAYFQDFLDFYTPFKVACYSLKEILCEKIRALLTRQAFKLRDVYDVFMIEKAGMKVENFREEIMKKIVAAMKFERYRKSVERSAESIELESVISDPYELEIFISKPESEFFSFAKKLENFLREIATSAVKL